MKSFIFSVLLMAATGFGLPAGAQTVLLVHGYASDAGTWDASGIQWRLAERGWQPAGVILSGPAGPRLIPAAQASGGDRVYTVNLPAAAPIGVQSAHLRAAIALLEQRHPDDGLIVVGHSAGGVVARAALVGAPPGNIRALITIASPHLGTERALQGLETVNARPFFCPGPGIDLLKELVGGSDYDYLEASQPLLHDLAPSGLGNLLGWLNVQPHPPIRYISVVRRAPYALGDEWVPGFSQDMNNVPALRGRASTYVALAGHHLQAQDGVLLAELLSELDTVSDPAAAQ